MSDDSYNESSQDYINPELRAYLRRKQEEDPAPSQPTEHCLCAHAIENWDGVSHDRRCRFANRECETCKHCNYSIGVARFGEFAGKYVHVLTGNVLCAMTAEPRAAQPVASPTPEEIAKLYAMDYSLSDDSELSLITEKDCVAAIREALAAQSKALANSEEENKILVRSSSVSAQDMARLHLRNEARLAARIKQLESTIEAQSAAREKAEGERDDWKSRQEESFAFYEDERKQLEAMRQRAEKAEARVRELEQENKWLKDRV